MTDAPPHIPTPASRKPIPITQEELLAHWEETIDRVIAGETFMIVINGKPTAYLMPFREYEQSLHRKLQAEKVEHATWLKTQEKTVARGRDNEAEVIHDLPVAARQPTAAGMFPPVLISKDAEPIWSVRVNLPEETDAETRRYVEEDQLTSWTVMIHTALYSYRAHHWTCEELNAEICTLLQESIRNAAYSEVVDDSPAFWRELEHAAMRRLKATRQLEAEEKIGNLMLPKELYEFIEERMATGLFKTPTEVICAAMPYLRKYRETNKPHPHQQDVPHDQ